MCVTLTDRLYVNKIRADTKGRGSGFDKIGVPKGADGPQSGSAKLRVVDATSGQPVFCRVNVVGADGNYYEPLEGTLKTYSFTGEWPKWPKARPPIHSAGTRATFAPKWSKATANLPGASR